MRDYDIVDNQGHTVLSVRALFPEEPTQCCMCDKPTYSYKCVPYYCGPVRTGASEGGYATACERCYAKWERWDDAGAECDSWISVLKGEI